MRIAAFSAVCTTYKWNKTIRNSFANWRKVSVGDREIIFLRPNYVAFFFLIFFFKLLHAVTGSNHERSLLYYLCPAASCTVSLLFHWRRRHVSRSGSPTEEHPGSWRSWLMDTAAGQRWTHLSWGVETNPCSQWDHPHLHDVQSEIIFLWKRVRIGLFLITSLYFWAR